MLRIALARAISCAFGEFVAFGGEQVVHVHRLPVDERASGESSSRLIGHLLQTHRYRAMMRAEAQVVAILQEHNGIIGIAKLAGALDNGLEDRLDIGRRGCDHLEDVARFRSDRSAPRMRSRVLACTSSNSRTFSIAMAAWSAKVVASSICLSVKGRTSETR